MVLCLGSPAYSKNASFLLHIFVNEMGITKPPQVSRALIYKAKLTGSTYCKSERGTPILICDSDYDSDLQPCATVNGPQVCHGNLGSVSKVIDGKH